MAAWKASLAPRAVCCDRPAMSASASPRDAAPRPPGSPFPEGVPLAQPQTVLPWAALANRLPPAPDTQVPAPALGPALALRTRVHPVVRLQLVLEAELLATTIALVGFLARVDAFVALECALIPEAAATELTLVRVVACGDKGLDQGLASPRPLSRRQQGTLGAPGR